MRRLVAAVGVLVVIATLSIDFDRGGATFRLEWASVFLAAFGATPFLIQFLWGASAGRGWALYLLECCGLLAFVAAYLIFWSAIEDSTSSTTGLWLLILVPAQWFWLAALGIMKILRTRPSEPTISIGGQDEASDERG